MNTRRAALTDEKYSVEELRTLRKREEHLRITLASIGDAVIATDDTGRVTTMNPVAETLTGLD
jgi:PAS domain-containing protein